MNNNKAIYETTALNYETGIIGNDVFVRFMEGDDMLFELRLSAAQAVYLIQSISNNIHAIKAMKMQSEKNTTR